MNDVTEAEVDYYIGQTCEMLASLLTHLEPSPRRNVYEGVYHALSTSRRLLDTPHELGSSPVADAPAEDPPVALCSGCRRYHPFQNCPV